MKSDTYLYTDVVELACLSNQDCATADVIPVIFLLGCTTVITFILISVTLFQYIDITLDDKNLLICTI